MGLVIVAFVVGLFVGSSIGILVTALCVAAKGNEERVNAGE